MKWILACLSFIQPPEVELTIAAETEWISSCHVAMTQYYFDHPEAQCFCIERTPDELSNSSRED